MLLWLALKAFFGKIPFPLLHIAAPRRTPPAPAVEVIGAESQMDVVKQIVATLNGEDQMIFLLFTTWPGHCRP